MVAWGHERGHRYTSVSTLSDWTAVLYNPGHAVLHGYVSGRPSVPDGAEVITSRIVLITNADGMPRALTANGSVYLLTTPSSHERTTYRSAVGLARRLGVRFSKLDKT